jgi:hypothetical protein
LKQYDTDELSLEVGSLVERIETPGGSPNIPRHGINVQYQLCQPMKPKAG